MVATAETSATGGTAATGAAWRGAAGTGPAGTGGIAAGTGGGAAATDLSRISALARIGSASAARAVWGGFSALEAGAEAAYCAFPADHWPELRLLVAITSRRRKPQPSRDAMLHVAATSPYYEAWVAAAEATFQAAVEAVRARDLERLGPPMRASYLRMFGTMFAADPPINYLRPQSLQVLEVLEELRTAGVGAWETMDAGPQVKIACLAADVERIRAALVAGTDLTPTDLIETAPGPGPCIID